MDELLKKVLGLLIGIVVASLVAFAVVKIVKVVSDRITAANIAKYGKEALASEAKTRDLIAQAIQFKVTSCQGKEVSLDALRNGRKVAKIKLQGDSVADDVKVGMTISAA